MSLVSSTINATGTSSTASMSTIPMPRISSLPAMVGGAEATSRSPARLTMVWSSLTRTKPRSSRRSARSDLPAPDGPVMSTARPSVATVLAWSVSADSRASGDRAVHARCAAGKRMVKRAPGWRVVAVLHVNLPVMAFDDRLGDGEAEPRMAAEVSPSAVLSEIG